MALRKDRSPGLRCRHRPTQMSPGCKHNLVLPDSLPRPSPPGLVHSLSLRWQEEALCLQREVVRLAVNPPHLWRECPQG